MAAEQRRLLAQLMGDQLMNSGSSAQRASLTITDPKVCRSYLCGACPHDLFTNTKQDLGPCPLAHQPNHKEEWLAASDEKKQEWGFEFDYQRDITRHVAECDRKIDVLQRRLEKTAEEIKQTNSLLKAITDYERTMTAGLLEVEILAEEGAVNLAVQEFHKLKLIRVQKEDKERELKTLSDTSGPSGHQKLQVCDVCGAYLSRLDNDRRLADHFFGKMHLGFAQMRKESERLAKELKGRPAPVRDEPMNDAPPARYGEEGYGDRGSGYGGGYGRGARRSEWTDYMANVFDCEAVKIDEDGTVHSKHLPHTLLSPASLHFDTTVNAIHMLAEVFSQDVDDESGTSPTRKRSPRRRSCYGIILHLSCCVAAATAHIPHARHHLTLPKYGPRDNDRSLSQCGRRFRCFCRIWSSFSMHSVSQTIIVGLQVVQPADDSIMPDFHLGFALSPAHHPQRLRERPTTCKDS
nr:u1 snrnp-associated protein [Quercus suber]